MSGEEEYEVEKILDSRLRRGHIEFLVKWKGYNEGHNSWEVRRDVHAPGKIVEFYLQHPRAPRRISFAAFDSLPFSRVDASLNCRSTHRGNKA